METGLVESLIRILRGQRVLLDADLAQVYGVSTKRLNEAIRRNAEKFPEDFAFLLRPQEVASMRSQFATASRRNVRHLPWAFTEHGAIMAATVLSSPRAVQMSVFVVRAFVKMRETLAQSKELESKLAELERNLTDRLDDQEQAIVHILADIKKFMAPPPAGPSREIGFHVKEDSPDYPSAKQQKTCV